MLKKITFYTLILLVFLSIFTAWGLHLMEIEDHYGDLQEVYFKSNSGDLILNKKTRNFGIISKDWKRVNVITRQKDTLDLYYFVNENKYETFRNEKGFDFNNLTFEKISQLRNKKIIKSILNN